MDDLDDPVQKAVHKFKDHPSIREIKKNVSVENMFNSKKIDTKVMLAELRALNPKQSGTFKDIPVRILKKKRRYCCVPSYRNMEYRDCAKQKIFHQIEISRHHSIT